MTEKELWKYFWDRKVSHSKPLDRDFIWITKEDFLPVKDHFVKEFNILHSGESFRSKAYFSHIHAVEQEEHVFFHKDFGNLARFFPLGIFHLFLDVMPYVVLARIKRVPMRSMFVSPK